MENLVITKGDLELKFVGPVCIGIGTVGDYSQITANSILPESDQEYKKEKEEIEGNMMLYADAGNTANKCGLLPSELLDQRNELLEALRECKDALSSDGSDKCVSAYLAADEAITKALK